MPDTDNYVRVDITGEEKEGLKNVFSNFGRIKSEEEIFYDLCFCICAPQTTFISNRKVINELYQKDFYKKGIEPRSVLEEICKPVRFYRNKARYLVEMREKFDKILEIIMVNSENICISHTKREFLVKNVKGLGMKAASHFLRNMGDDNLAIIDTHVIKFLQKHGLFNISESKMNDRVYSTLEKLFQRVARSNGLSPAVLDALIWQRYSGTKWEDFKY